jgi:hypothetical protein
MTATQFISMTPEGIRTALAIIPVSNRLTLVKGEGFDAWRADITPVSLVFGEPTVPKRDADMANLVECIRAWLDSEELP